MDVGKTDVGSQLNAHLRVVHPEAAARFFRNITKTFQLFPHSLDSPKQC